jgi:hypothetical protein
MAISLSVNKARLSTFAVNDPGGAPNITAALNAQSGNGTVMRCRVNPSNNREVGVLGLQDNGGATVNATVSVTLSDGTHSASTGFTVAPNNQPGSITAGDWGDEITPPAWLTAP